MLCQPYLRASNSAWDSKSGVDHVKRGGERGSEAKRIPNMMHKLFVIIEIMVSG
jgi:hypothetical protein